MSNKESIISIANAVLNGAMMQIKDTNGRPICNVNIGKGSANLGCTGNRWQFSNCSMVSYNS